MIGKTTYGILYSNTCSRLVMAKANTHGRMAITTLAISNYTNETVSESTYGLQTIDTKAILKIISKMAMVPFYSVMATNLKASINAESGAEPVLIFGYESL